MTKKLYPVYMPAEVCIHIEAESAEEAKEIALGEAGGQTYCVSFFTSDDSVYVQEDEEESYVDEDYAEDVEEDEEEAA